MTYDYSNLVNVYYDEAKRCLEARCWFAAISMFWSTVEYAVEHELRGGSKVAPDTLAPLRGPTEYDARRIKKKLNIFFGLFPRLQEFKSSLQRLYDYRTVYVHARIGDLAHEPIDESISQIDLKGAYDRPLGVSIMLAGERHMPRPHGQQEVDLIGTAPVIAEECCRLANQFLDALGRELHP